MSRRACRTFSSTGAPYASGSRYWLSFSEEKPDLRTYADEPGDCVWPRSQGAFLSGRFYYTKEGRTPVAPFSIDVPLSTDDVIDSGDTLIERFTFDDPNTIPGYDPTSSPNLSISYAFNLPPGLPGGHYHLGFILDSLDEIDEFFEVNNVGYIQQMQLESP